MRKIILFLTIFSFSLMYWSCSKDDELDGPIKEEPSDDDDKVTPVEGRGGWLLELNWPESNAHWKFGATYALANLYNYPKGSARSNKAVSDITLIMGDQYSESRAAPLGVIRAIYMFGKRFSDSQLDKIRIDSQAKTHWAGGGTENHHIMALCNGYLLAQKFPTGLWYPGGTWTAKVTSAELMTMNKEELRKQGQLQYERSFYEALSPTYLAIHIVPLLNLFDFAIDEEVKSIAEAMLYHILARLSVNSYEGYILDPYNRFYNSCFTNGGIGPGADDGNKTPGVLFNWLYWNQFIPTEERFVSPNAFNDNLYMVYAALSGFRPPVELEHIANIYTSGKAHWVKTSEPQSRTVEPYVNGDPWSPGAYRRRVWRDKEFAMSSAVGYHIPNGFYNASGSKFGIAYRTADRLNYIQAGHPYFNSNATDLSWWQGPDSPFMQVAHHQNTAIVMFNIPSADPWPNEGREDLRQPRQNHVNSLRKECAVRYPLSMDEAVTVNNPDETTWYFLREGETYIGIRTLTPAGTPQEYAGSWRSLFAVPSDHGGRSQSGFIIEIGNSKTVGGRFDSFDAFQTVLTQQQPTVVWGSGTTPSLTVEYTNAENVTLKTEYDYNLDSDGEFKVHMFPGVWVNGNPDLSDPWPDIDARTAGGQPLVTMVNKVLTITDPANGTGMSIDWNGNLPVINK